MRLISRLLLALPIVALALASFNSEPALGYNNETVVTAIGWGPLPYGYFFSGVDVSRPDSSIGSIPYTNCGSSSPATGRSDSSVLQAQHVRQSTSPYYIEFGTVHQCADTIRFWYWV